MSKSRLGKKIFRSRIFQFAIGYLVHNILRFVYHTNNFDYSKEKEFEKTGPNGPVIFALWHGQHFLAPYIYSKEKRKNITTLVSKSPDAQFNAFILKLAGYRVVRGSGGRVREAAVDKGGVSATLELRTNLKNGKNVCMIADISKSSPRKSGRGIVTLAKLSGCPIVPLVIATSRFKVVESSWDKTTINLPFGRSSVGLGNPIYIPADSSVEELDVFRTQLDEELDRVTQEAYQAVGRIK